MIRLLLIVTLILIVLLSGALAATHARSLTPSLDDLLATSPGCNGTGLCFMGIYPGASSLEQAAQALHDNPWVGTVNLVGYSEATWTWSGQQPDFIDPGVPGSAIERDYAHISVIRVKTRYNYGDIWLQLGKPGLGYAMLQPGGFLQGIYYNKYSMLAINVIACPSSIRDFWSLPVIVQFGDAYVMLDDHYQENFARFRAC